MRGAHHEKKPGCKQDQLPWQKSEPQHRRPPYRKESTEHESRGERRNPYREAGDEQRNQDNDRHAARDQQHPVIRLRRRRRFVAHHQLFAVADEEHCGGSHHQCHEAERGHPWQLVSRQRVGEIRRRQ